MAPYLGKNPKPKKNKKEKKMNKCPCCGATIRLVNANEMNFRDLKPGAEYTLYWRCSRYPVCDTYIKADPRTKQPSGLMGGPELRHKRICLHHWENLFVVNHVMTKFTFREMCASLIGLRHQGLFHTRDLTEYQCDTILNHLQKLYENQQKVHDLVEKFNNSTPWKQVHGLNTKPNHGIRYDQFGNEIIPVNEEQK